MFEFDQRDKTVGAVELKVSVDFHSSGPSLNVNHGLVFLSDCSKTLHFTLTLCSNNLVDIFIAILTLLLYCKIQKWLGKMHKCRLFQTQLQSLNSVLFPFLFHCK